MHRVFSRSITRSPRRCRGARRHAAPPARCTSAARWMKSQPASARSQTGGIRSDRSYSPHSKAFSTRTRAPEGRHTLWAYCHVPHGSGRDMTEAIEHQIERFAPGFRDCVLARRTLDAAGLEHANANLIGGDINGGAANLWQLIARPVVSPTPYRTPLPRVLPLFLFHAPRRRRPRDVWLSCSEGRVAGPIWNSHSLRSRLTN